MEIKEVVNKEEWESFIGWQEPTSILQSWVWREFLESDGASPKTFFVADRGQTLAAAVVAKIFLPLGKYYLYLPRGPIFKTGLSSSAKQIVINSFARSLQKREVGAIFLRLDPALGAKDINWHASGLSKANKEVQPKQTVILRLDQTKEELLDKMKPKTRYNVRLAEKKALQIIMARSNTDIEAFYKLLKLTGERTKFSPHPLKHYLDLWQTLAPKNLRVYLAQSAEGKVVAGIMICYYRSTATYLHGASDNNYRSLMAPYLLHWTAILDAARNGLKEYDFWGVAPERSTDDHLWSGITRFKKGFGGTYLEYGGAYDYVYSKVWYKAFNLLRSLKQKLG